MRYLLLLLLIPTLLSSEEFDDKKTFGEDSETQDEAEDFSAVRNYYKGKEAIQTTYRTSLSEALKRADGAEVLLLSFTMQKEIPAGKDENYLLISPYASYSKILAKRTLKGDLIKQCRNHAVSLLKEPYLAGPMCHFPIHGLRLFRGEELIFETSLCWHCSNYYLEYPDDYDTASWVGFGRNGLEDFLKKVLPIPQSEIDRFNAEYGKQTKPAQQDAAPN